MAAPLYLTSNAADDAATYHYSGNRSVVRGPVDDKSATGSAVLDISGTFNAENGIEYKLRCTDTTALGVQPMRTTPVADAGNVGDGGITVAVKATNTTAESWVAECIHSGSSTTASSGTSADYDETNAEGDPKGLFVESQLAGSLGNQTTIDIAAAPAGSTHDWTGAWTQRAQISGLHAAPTGVNVTKQTRIVLATTPVGTISVGNIIAISIPGAAPAPADLTTYGLYRVCGISKTGASVHYIDIWRSLRATIGAAPARNIFVLGSAGGFRITVNDAAGPTTEIFDELADGAAIRSTSDVRGVLNNGGKVWAGGALYNACTSTLAKFSTGADPGNYVPEVENFALSGGSTTPVGTGYASFRVHSESADAYVDADSAAHDLSAVGNVPATSDLTITLTPGNVGFAAGDTFRWSTVYAEFELSRDGGAYAGTYYSNPSGYTITDGLMIEWTLSADTQPWVVGDIWKWRSDYQYNGRNVRDGDRNTSWRTNDTTWPYSLIFDAGLGSTAAVRGAWVFDWNLSTSATCYLAGTDVQPYGTITAISPPLAASQVQDSAWEGGAGPINYFTAGYMIITSGAARNCGYEVLTNSANGIFTMQVGDTPTADGVAIGDSYILVEPSPPVELTFIDSATSTYVEGVYLTASEARRYWCFVMWDAAGGTSYSEISCLYFGVPVQPATYSPYYRDDHRQPILIPRILDTPSGRRRVLNDGTLRERIVHDYIGDQRMGVDSTDYAILQGVVTAAWDTTANNLPPTLIVEDPTEPETFDLADFVEDQVLSRINSKAYAVALTWETRERAGA